MIAYMYIYIILYIYITGHIPDIRYHWVSRWLLFGTHPWYLSLLKLDHGMGVSVIQQEMRELLGPWLPWRTVSHNQRVKPQTSFVKKMQLQVVRRNQTN